MKSNFKILLPALAVLGALVWAGCQTQYPTTYASVNSPGAMVIDFESGLGVDPNLAEALAPNNRVKTPGTVTTYYTPPATKINGGVTTIVNYGSGSFSLVSPGADYTNTCIHETGNVIDHADGTYPGGQLQIPIEGFNNFYNASLFTGVKFYLWVPGDDTAGKRTFSIPVAQTQPPSAGGSCNLSATSNSCYNDFSVTYSNTTGWVLVTVPFSSMTRGSYGASITPSTLSGINLQQTLMLDWTEGNNNAAATVNVDLYLDQVQFY